MTKSMIRQPVGQPDRVATSPSSGVRSAPLRWSRMLKQSEPGP